MKLHSELSVRCIKNVIKIMMGFYDVIFSHCETMVEQNFEINCIKIRNK